MIFQPLNNELVFRGISAHRLAEEFGTPLYLYDEEILRKNCRQLQSLSQLDNFTVYYSAKANANIALLKIIREEGLRVDAMSLGELALEEAAGFTPKEILFLGNNLKESDLFAVSQKKIQVCLDSLDQLKRYLDLAPTTQPYLRVNPGVGFGAGHHEKVITAGKVKFGIEVPQLAQAFRLAKEKGSEIKGLMLHIGSLFLDPTPWLTAIAGLLELAKQFPEVDYLDFGGGIGVPYNRQNEQRFPFQEFGDKLDLLLTAWMKETGRAPQFAIEPGRFVVAEAGATLCEVQSVKTNSGVHFAGTDCGFNFLLRPELYEAYHEIIKANNLNSGDKLRYQVTGNVCESGDNLGKDRLLAKLAPKDLLLIRDTGAYGHVMASNYNAMPRPAEVLITHKGQARLIRRRENIADLLQSQTI